jgi:hypothetical protein
MVTDEERNLVSNGSFAESLDGWAGWNARLSLLPRGREQAGAAVVHSTGTSSGYSLYTSPRPLADLRAGATYVGTAMVRSPGRHGGLLCLALREWAPSGAAVGTSRKCLQASSRWQTFPRVSHTVHIGGSELELLFVSSAAPPGASFVVDQVKLVPAAG